MSVNVVSENSDYIGSLGLHNVIDREEWNKCICGPTRSIPPEPLIIRDIEDNNFCGEERIRKFRLRYKELECQGIG